MSISLFKRQLVEDDRKYMVQVKNFPHYSLAFNTRKDARNYKRGLQNSTKQLKAEIHVIEFTGGYQLPERVTT